MSGDESPKDDAIEWCDVVGLSVLWFGLVSSAWVIVKLLDVCWRLLGW